MDRRLVILTEGYSNPHTAKTACSVMRYRPNEVLAVLDSTCQGQTAAQLLGVGGDIPVIANLDEAPDADTLLIGIAPPGGKIPEPWRRVVLQAIHRGMDVVSGLHDFLNDDADFVAAARQSAVRLIDIRKNTEHEIARNVGLRDDCLRILTVGHDCSVGKMVTAIEISSDLRRRGHDAKFIATGQTGILVEGDGCPVDCVVADFVSGAVERMVLEHQQHDFLIVEGQGSLVHPSYSGVTLSLLHGCAPHGLILCYEVGRETVTGISHMQIPPLAKIRQLNEMMASVVQPCSVIGIAINAHILNEQEADAECQRVQDEFQLPACDIFRHGAQPLTDAVLRLRDERRSDSGRSCVDVI